MTVHGEHLYAGTLCGALACWSLTQLKHELTKPSSLQYNEQADDIAAQEGPEVDLDDLIPAQILKRVALVNLKLGNINQVLSCHSGLLIASKQGISLYNTTSSQISHLL